MDGKNTVPLGASLRQVRNERRLSVDEVALSLKLSPRIIAALEEEAYDELPGPTYVRGYLRSYGMLLGLPPQQLIEQFNNLPKAAQRMDMTAPAPVRQVTSSDTMIRFGTLLVAVIVFGLAALWWSGKDGSNRRRPAAVATAPSSSVMPDSAAETSGAPAVVPEPIAKPTEPSSNVTEKPAVAAPAAAPMAAPEALPTPPPVDPNAPRARLTLRVSEDSWADIRDAEQRRLLYETVAAGRVVSVEGPAPLSVFLGNVEGVTVEYNGKPYDALRHKRGQIARFTLTAGGN